MKTILLTTLFTTIAVSASIKLSDEGFIGCKNILTQPMMDKAVTLQRCYGNLSLKVETIDISAIGGNQ